MSKYLKYSVKSLSQITSFMKSQNTSGQKATLGRFPVVSPTLRSQGGTAGLWSQPHKAVRLNMHTMVRPHRTELSDPQSL